MNRQVEYFSKTANQIDTYPYMFGALVEALILHLRASDQADSHYFISQLLENAPDNKWLKSALVSALRQYGLDNRPLVNHITNSLIGDPTPPPKNNIAAISRLLNQRDDITSLEAFSVGAAVAAEMHFSEKLAHAAAEPNPTKRTIAVQNIFHMWKDNSEAGYEALELLSKNVNTNRWVPNPAVIESMLGVIGGILGYDHETPDLVDRVLGIGRKALRQLFLLGDKPATWFKRILHNWVLIGILNFVLAIMSRWGDRVWINAEGLAHIFTLRQDQKDLLASLVHLVDPDQDFSLDRMDDYIAAQEIGGQLNQVVVELALISHGVKDFDKTLAIVEGLSEYALSTNPPRYWANGPISALWQSAMRIEKPNIRFLELANKILEAIHADIDAWLEQSKKDRPFDLPADNEVLSFGTLIGIHKTYQEKYPDKYIPDFPPLVEQRIKQAIDDSDSDYLALFIEHELHNKFEMGLYDVALAGIKPLIQVEMPEVQKALIKLLVRLRQYNPEHIENLLISEPFPNNIRIEVMAAQSGENLADLVSYQLAKIIYDVFILGPQSLRDMYKWFLHQALIVKDLKTWLTLIIKELLNNLVGEPIFKVPEDAPSMQVSKN